MRAITKAELLAVLVVLTIALSIAFVALRHSRTISKRRRDATQIAGIFASWSA